MGGKDGDSLPGTCLTGGPFDEIGAPTSLDSPRGVSLVSGTDSCRRPADHRVCQAPIRPLKTKQSGDLRCVIGRVQVILRVPSEVNETTSSYTLSTQYRLLRAIGRHQLCRSRPRQPIQHVDSAIKVDFSDPTFGKQLLNFV